MINFTKLHINIPINNNKIYFNTRKRTLKNMNNVKNIKHLIKGKKTQPTRANDQNRYKRLEDVVNKMIKSYHRAMINGDANINHFQ